MTLLYDVEGVAVTDTETPGRGARRATASDTLPASHQSALHRGLRRRRACPLHAQVPE